MATRLRHDPPPHRFGRLGPLVDDNPNTGKSVPTKKSSAATASLLRVGRRGVAEFAS
jgi:hypothetical protein